MTAAGWSFSWSARSLPRRSFPSEVGSRGLPSGCVVVLREPGD